MTRPIVQLCVHGETKPHYDRWVLSEAAGGNEYTRCPGGRVLNQAIIWWCETHQSEAQTRKHDLCWAFVYIPFADTEDCVIVEKVLLDALTSAQENQP